MWKPSKDRFIGTAEKQGDVASLARGQQQQQQKLLACGILCLVPRILMISCLLGFNHKPGIWCWCTSCTPPGAPRLCWQRSLPASRRSPWLPSPVCRIACSSFSSTNGKSRKQLLKSYGFKEFLNCCIVTWFYTLKSYEYWKCMHVMMSIYSYIQSYGIYT